MKISKNKKNCLYFNDSDIRCLFKNFSDLSKNEIISISKLKSENFKIINEENSNHINILDHRSHHFLILYDKKLIGYSRLVPPDFNFNKLTLEKFCVSKDFRSMGISKILMKSIFEKIQKLYPLETLYLSSLEETKKFYEKFGFFSEYLIYDENGKPHHHMTKIFK
jgi:ElaA protein